MIHDELLDKIRRLHDGPERGYHSLSHPLALLKLHAEVEGRLHDSDALPDGLPADEAADMAMFLDMDLSILAAPADVFDAYEGGVRHEYREIPEPLFRDGRARILEGFLARVRLYLSDWGHTRFEAKARASLARSIGMLRISE